MVKKIDRKIWVILGLILIVYFLLVINLWQFRCSTLGYTLCAAIAQDLNVDYQAGVNVLANRPIYGEAAKTVLSTPYFVQFRYFPITAFFAVPITLLVNFETLYKIYIVFLNILILCGGILIFWFLGKYRKNWWQALIPTAMYLLFFAYQADWRMGQYVGLSGLFLLLAYLSIIYQKKIAVSLAWLGSMIAKPISIFGIFYFIKKKDWLTVILFFILFGVFTFLYFWRYFPGNTLGQIWRELGYTFTPAAIGWQIHYTDNFSFSSMLAEFFYDNNHILYNLLYYQFLGLTILIPIIYLFWKDKFTIDKEIYFISFLALAFFIVNKEAWESHLVFLAPILAILFYIGSSRREKIFLFIIWLILATPSLYYFWEISSSRPDWLRTLLICEKALPIFILYVYLIVKIFEKKDVLNDKNKI